MKEDIRYGLVVFLTGAVCGLTGMHFDEINALFAVMIISAAMGLISSIGINE